MILTTAGLMWLIMGVICFVLEMMLPGFVLFFFGIGSWITALSCWLFHVGLNTQLSIFIVSSLLTLFLLRRFIQKRFRGDESMEDEGVSVAIGEKAVVLEDIIPPQEGKISYAGTQWRARAEEVIEEGKTVFIVGQKGAVMEVSLYGSSF